MEKESPESLRIFLPSVCIALSLLVFFINDVRTEMRERKALSETLQKNEEQLGHLPRISNQLEKVAGSLLNLSKTNEAAAFLVKKHQIQTVPPPTP